MPPGYADIRVDDGTSSSRDVEPAFSCESGSRSRSDANALPGSLEPCNDAILLSSMILAPDELPPRAELDDAFSGGGLIVRTCGIDESGNDGG